MHLGWLVVCNLERGRTLHIHGVTGRFGTTTVCVEYCTIAESMIPSPGNANCYSMHNAIDLCTQRHKESKVKRRPCYLGPNFSSTRGPCSSHSCFVIHMFSLSAIWWRGIESICISKGSRSCKLTIFASTAPPRKTMCLRRGGSSMRTLNFCGIYLASDSL